ncbi:hypothetical protein MTX26_27095 [Bradyrhizobium sp. ISRA443]|uniref:hypothetical protein n=1 Tax=unclassified Bradyrhizobium TaxID=2631580 RepID=UPI00247A9BB5|nr:MULTISPECIES: hypothetical protein [unclassified Bradyrhizobium]WGR97965.1 hypothetical protein MTX23_27090 [Bradyrhizobium sp. ISRA436]WGS04855.1 hypothetical protein MTX18_27100 [Bradyrhizobium sp. ISRA437]WGS11736.1 hypothetical protein MTX26_27095 [Bradyrhizobium sp. ISRA443]
MKADTGMPSRFLRREAITRKKKTLAPREQDRPNLSRHGAQWRHYQDRIDPARLVFIDESVLQTSESSST